MAGKRAIVTGAASGIGAAMARRFALAGARVVTDVSAVDQPELLRECVENGLTEVVAAGS